jgi:hypothetical protein
MFNTPVIWLAAAVLISAGLGGYAVKKNAEIGMARNEGIAIGTGEAATKTLEEAMATAEAERFAEETTPLPPDKTAIIALCKRSASCKERYTLK